MKVTVTASVLLLLISSLASAQIPTGVKANIEFSFYIPAGKLLPAGTYEYKVTEGTTETTLYISNMKTGERFMVPIVTTISKKPASDAEIVFDKTGNSYYLSEVFIPGMDGLLVKGAPGRHTHEVVKAK